jgi:CBS domain-containing protein
MNVWRTEECLRAKVYPLERQFRFWMVKCLNAKDIMHSPTFVSPDKPIVEAVKKMENNNISSVLVGTAEDAIGMFTERDVLREVVMRGIDAKKVLLYDLMCNTELKEVMCRVLTTVNENTPLEEVAEMMMGRYVRHMPVTNDDGKIVGVLSARTVMNGLKYSYFTRRKK